MNHGKPIPESRPARRAFNTPNAAGVSRDTDTECRHALADTLPELLEKLRPGGDRQRTVAVLYLDPDPPEMIL